MEHHFNVEIACKLGVEKATLLHNLAFWIKKNVANRVNFHDGYYWTYNTAEAFSELLPYFNSKKIGRLLNDLETSGVIKSGNYNKIQFDRTKWYTITDDNILELYKIPKTNNGISNSQILEMEDTKNENGNTESVQPIPYNKPDSKPNEKQNIYLPSIKQEIDMLIRTKGLNFSVEELLKEAKGDSELVIQSIKLYGDKGAGYLKDSIKKRYIDNIKQETKTEVDHKTEFFAKYKKSISVLEVAYNNNKLTGDQLVWAEEILRGEGRI